MSTTVFANRVNLRKLMGTPMQINFAEARQHFLETDVTLSALIAHLDVPEFERSIPKPVPPSEYGAHLVRAIIAQQLSTKAAATITERVRAAAGALTPEAVAALREQTLRAAGVSGSKIRYLRALADLLPTLPMTDFSNWPNDRVVETLTTIPGIGPWTAEMFLIFAMARSDVFTLRDLGLRDSFHYYYRLEPRHHRKRDGIIARWHPHGTVASLVLWRARDTGLPRP